jgi:hypothetical protein
MDKHVMIENVCFGKSTRVGKTVFFPDLVFIGSQKGINTVLFVCVPKAPHA